jgi:hypothetical protein
MKGLALLATTALAVVSMAVAILAGCTPGTVNILRGITPSEGPGIRVGVAKTFILEGTGTCRSVTVDWGDGEVQENFVPVPGRRIELESSALETRYLSHTYTGWGGGKTITVVGNGCEGTVRARFQADPRTISIGWNARAPAGTTGVCQTTTAVPPLTPRMLVRINLTTLAAFRDVDFGCSPFGCTYNADGKVGSVAAAPFPFPGLVEYSAVFRVGSQVIQGGTNTQFTTTTGGTLMFCLNDGDNDLTNNRGGFDVTLSADQLGP